MGSENNLEQRSSFRETARGFVREHVTPDMALYAFVSCVAIAVMVRDLNRGQEMQATLDGLTALFCALAVARLHKIRHQKDIAASEVLESAEEPRVILEQNPEE